MRSRTIRGVTTATLMAGIAVVAMATSTSVGAQNAPINITVEEHIFNTYDGVLDSADLVTRISGADVEDNGVVDVASLVAAGSPIIFESDAASGYWQHFECYRPATGEKLLNYGDFDVDPAIVGVVDPAIQTLDAAQLVPNDEVTCVSTSIQAQPAGEVVGEIFTHVIVRNLNGGNLQAHDVEMRIDGVVVPPVYGRSPLLDAYSPAESVRTGGLLVFSGDNLFGEVDPVEVVVPQVAGYRLLAGCQNLDLAFGGIDDEEIQEVAEDPATVRFTPGEFNDCTFILIDDVPQPEPEPSPGDGTETEMAPPEPEPVIPGPGDETETEAAPESPPEPVPTCNGLEVTIDLSKGEVPTPGDDVIRGTADADLINGLGGNDTICGLQGDDVINAGAGFDRVFAGSGDDVVNGGIGNDRLVGGLGNDDLRGGNGNDRVQGGPGDDELRGGNGLDRLAGGDGNDELRGGGSADALFGNLGRDVLYGEDGDDVLRGGGWRDVMNGGNGRNDGCTLADPGGLIEERISCEGGVFGR